MERWKRLKTNVILAATNVTVVMDHVMVMTTVVVAEYANVR
jgi:hypothetical protein